MCAAGRVIFEGRELNPAYSCWYRFLSHNNISVYSLENLPYGIKGFFFSFVNLQLLNIYSKLICISDADLTSQHLAIYLFPGGNKAKEKGEGALYTTYAIGGAISS